MEKTFTWILSAAFVVFLYVLAACSGAASAADADGRLLALCVGLKYPGTGNSLRFSTDDVRAVSEAFRNSSGYREDQRRVEVLIDDDPTAAKPDAGEVRKRLAALANAAEEEDRLLFFYSGHGILDQEGHSVLICGSGDDLLDEAGHLALSEVKDIMARSRARDKLAIIDACHSGGKSATDGNLTPDSVAAAMGGPSEAKAADDPVAWLVSSSANEKSWEDEETGHGLFTRFFLEAVGESAELADIDYDGRLSVRELHDFVSQSMAAHILAKKRDRDAKWRGIRQTPQLGIGGVRDPDDRRLRRLHLFYYDAGTVQSAAAALPSTPASQQPIPPATTQRASSTQPKDNPQTFFNRGYSYYSGKNVPQDYVEAAMWFRKAAEQGHASAQNWLGHVYEKGQGVPKDLAEAAKWYRMAAEQGNASAQFNLGYAYKHGEGVSRNSAEAVKWYRMAAEQGNASAQCNLGYAYEHGEGVSRNSAEAVKWYRKAAEQGNASAQFNLGRAYDHGDSVPKDYAEAKKWYQKAAEQGNAPALHQLGGLYRHGRGVPQNYSEGTRYYRLAAERGSGSAMHDLAHSYVAGRGVPTDYGQARYWMSEAAKKGENYCMPDGTCPVSKNLLGY